MNARQWRPRIRGRIHGDDGQALVSFALMAVVIMGMLALVVDLGLVFGQRRFDQNGADAGAFAAGRLLAGSVAPLNNNGDPYLSVPDADVYRAVRSYAGLDPANLASTVPTDRKSVV